MQMQIDHEKAKLLRRQQQENQQLREHNRFLQAENDHLRAKVAEQAAAITELTAAISTREALPATAAEQAATIAELKRRADGSIGSADESRPKPHDVVTRGSAPEENALKASNLSKAEQEWLRSVFSSGSETVEIALREFFAGIVLSCNGDPGVPIMSRPIQRSRPRRLRTYRSRIRTSGLQLDTIV